VIGKLTLALDAMGGDAGAPMVIEGAAIAKAENPDLQFIFYGKEDVVAPLVARHAVLSTDVQIIHTDDVVLAEDRPSHAVRRGRDSSMGMAVRAVCDGEAQVAVSAGNTGALMALAKILLKTIPGIDRPALASLFPTLKGESVMLDLGANVECSEENLVQFALMGAAFARTVLRLERPKVALLNIGSEDLKGNETVKNAGMVLRDTPLPMEFIGFTEGDGISMGDNDVIVTDGFTGNVALKTAEGTARLISEMLGRAFRASPFSMLGYFLIRKGLRSLKTHLDSNNHNGAVFLGLNGLVVKSHGGASPGGFATAIRHAVDMARHDLTHLIAEDLKNFESHSDESDSEIGGDAESKAVGGTAAGSS
jgi:glycerol-3-phosphate acyltransferase PlsX